MSLYFIFSSLFVIAYMIVQTISDIKTKKVYTNLNYVALLVVGLMYVVKCVSLGGSIQIQGLVGGFLFIVLHSVCLRSIMGTGDAKALVVMYYQSSLMHDDVFAFDLFFPVFVYFIATLLFSVNVVVDGIKKRKKAKDIFFGKERHAFFPFLLPSYVIGVVLWALSMPISK